MQTGRTQLKRKVFFTGGFRSFLSLSAIWFIWVANPAVHADSGGADPVVQELMLPEASLEQQKSLELNGLFTDGMVLQRDMPVPVWGRGPEGAAITVEFAGQCKTTVIDSSRHWKVILDPMPASSKPRKMTISSNHQSAIGNRQFADVLVGDVWLCSGQSNMQVEMKINAKKYPPRAADLEAAGNPLVHFFKIDPGSSRLPRRDIPPVHDNPYAPWENSFLNNRWRPCTKEWAPHVSATAYYFSRELQPQIGCPLGIVISARGGTAIDKWVPADVIRKDSCWAQRFRDQVDNAEQQWDQMMDPYKEKWGQFRKTYPDLHTLWLAQKEDRSLRAPAKPAWSSCFYNGQIHPLAPFAFKGVLWYQGENDTGHPEQYTEKMISMITAWRELWNRPDLPFIITQLAGYEYSGGGDAPELRAAQARVPEQLEGVYMATVVDAGMHKNIHPFKKDITGHRLALVALKEVYGQDVVAYGPIFKSVKREKGSLQITFDHTDGGLRAKEVDLDGTRLSADTLEGFEVCGSDGKYIKADAVVDGENRVTVSSDQVSSPASVRYAWANFPLANLYNGAGLPAIPFQTNVGR